MVIKAQGTCKECDVIHLEPIGTQSGKVEVRVKPVPDYRGLCVLGYIIQKLFFSRTGWLGVGVPSGLCFSED